MKIPAQQVLFRHALPVSPGGRQTSRQPDRQAWQREMERAQMDDWLEHPLTARAGKATDMERAAVRAPHQAATASPRVPTTCSRGPVPGFAQTRPDAGAAPAEATAAEITSGRTGTAPPPAQGSAAGSRQTENTATVHIVRHTAVPAAANKRPVAPARTETPAPRLSLEWQGDDVRLWLGIGAGDGVDAGDLARIVSEVRMVLAADGVRLREVMCNGRPLEVFLQNTVQEKRSGHSAQDVSYSASTPYFEHRQEQ